MGMETIQRFWVVTQKKDGRKFSTADVKEVDLCLKHPEMVHVAEVTITEFYANKMYKKDLAVLDSTAIELSTDPS